MSRQTWQETLITGVTDGPTLTAGTAASMLPPQAKFTLPANFFDYVGKQIMVKATGRLSLAATPGTCTFDVRFGATVVANGGAMVMATESYTNLAWYLEFLLTCRAIGTSATLFVQGFWTSQMLAGQPATVPKGGLVAMLPWNAGPAVGTAFDSTATQQVDLFFTESVATASLICHQYSLIAMN